MARPLRATRQVLAFARKEIADVTHQPRLLVTLVLGPFLVMAAFGVGYRDTPPRLRAVFVVPAESVFREQIDTYTDDMGAALEVVEVTSDPVRGADRLATGHADLVVTFPADPAGTVMSGEQAVIEVLHTRLDPIERTAIGFATDLAVDQVNGRILALVVDRGQELAAPAGTAVEVARTAIVALDAAASSGDADEWAAALDETSDVVADLDASLRTSSTVAAEFGSSAVRDALDQLRATLEELRGTETPDGATAGRIDQLREAADIVADRFDEVTALDPQVLVRPLAGEVRLAVEDVDRITDWYAPAAVMLMLQQFGVAFGALAFVRERQLGINEVFRIAPVGAGATVIGKYVAHLALGSLIGAVLTAGVVLLLDVPLAGSVADIAVAMGLTLAASIGLGLVVSLASASDAQAVQYTMIVLLASLFFSGFFLSLGQMSGVARVVSYALPVTYGMEMLRDVMLRGAGLDLRSVLLLAGHALVVFVVVMAGARRRMAATRA